LSSYHEDDVSPFIRVAAILAEAALIGAATGQTSTRPALSGTIIRVSGHVVDRVGSPLSNAVVKVRVPATGETTTATTTDAAGRFEIAAAPGPYELYVEAAGCVPYRRRMGPSSSSERDIGTIRMQPASSASKPQAAGSGAGTEDDPIRTTVCDLSSNPEDYEGKFVAVRADVTGYDMLVGSPTGACSASMRISAVFPEQLEPATDVHLIRDEPFYTLFQRMRHALRVEATLEGRFETGFTRQANNQIELSGRENGQGQHSAGLLILHRVSSVLAARRVQGDQ